MDKLIDNLEAILGRENVLSKPDELLVYECDGLPHHKHRPRAVVFPSSTEETAAVMRELARAKVPFTPRGAGTGLSGSTDGLLRYDLKGDSIAKSMILAAHELQIVDYISAAANSTPDLDEGEALAIKKVFGKRAEEISVGSLKSMLGEFDGSGGCRACGLALSLYHRKIPPTVGTEHLDPRCDLNVVLGQAKKMDLRSALLNGCSNGGSTFSLWFKRYSSG